MALLKNIRAVLNYRNKTKPKHNKNKIPQTSVVTRECTFCEHFCRNITSPIRVRARIGQSNSLYPPFVLSAVIFSPLNIFKSLSLKQISKMQKQKTYLKEQVVRKKY